MSVITSPGLFVRAKLSSYIKIFITSYPLPHPSPVLDYSDEHNIAMTSNPNGFLCHFHVICSYGLTPYRKSALPQVARGTKLVCEIFIKINVFEITKQMKNFIIVIKTLKIVFVKKPTLRVYPFNAHNIFLF